RSYARGFGLPAPALAIPRRGGLTATFKHCRYKSMQTISKWGNSLAVRIPAALAEPAGLEEGTVVDLKVRAGRLMVIPARSLRYDLHRLVGQITRKNRHRLVDWGK